MESCLFHHYEKIRKFWRSTIAESPLISSLRSILKNAMVIHYSIYFVAGFYEIAGIFKRFYRFCVFVNIYVKIDCLVRFALSQRHCCGRFIWIASGVALAMTEYESRHCEKIRKDFRGNPHSIHLCENLTR